MCIYIFLLCHFLYCLLFACQTAYNFSTFKTATYAALFASHHTVAFVQGKYLYMHPGSPTFFTMRFDFFSVHASPAPRSVALDIFFVVVSDLVFVVAATVVVVAASHSAWRFKFSLARRNVGSINLSITLPMRISSFRHSAKRATCNKNLCTHTHTHKVWKKMKGNQQKCWRCRWCVCSCSRWKTFA